MAAAARLLVLAAMRSFGDTSEGYTWARDRVSCSLLDDTRATLVTCGTPGPEVWAAALAHQLGLRVVSYLADGRRTDTHQPPGRWAPEGAKVSTFARDEALTRDLSRIAQQGRRIVVVGLLDAHEPVARSGTAHRLRLFEAAGLAVHRLTWSPTPTLTSTEAAPAAAE